MRRLAVAIVLCIAACRTTPTGPYTPPSEGQRNTTKAEQLNREAADLLDRDPARAEALLRQALTADLFFGPAHNNLGVLLLNKGALYEAANELEWARKLLPGHPDPRINLGICLERAGKLDHALKAYEAALEVWPDYLPAVQGLALATVRAGRGDERLTAWLDTIAQQSSAVPWRDWARRLRAARGDTPR